MSSDPLDIGRHTDWTCVQAQVTNAGLSNHTRLMGLNTHTHTHTQPPKPERRIPIDWDTNKSGISI